MSRKPVIRVGAAVLGGLAVALSLLGLLMVVNGGQGFAGCTAATAIGWTIPLLAGFLVGGTSWLLLTDRGGQDVSQEIRSSACQVCGNGVLDEWRMCPYCGTITEARKLPLASEQPVVE